MVRSLYAIFKLLSASLLLIPLGVSCVRTDKPIRGDRPNLILIITDDQNADTIAFMPTVQRLLIDGGSSFSQAFAPLPSCRSAARGARRSCGANTPTTTASGQTTV